MNIFLKNMRLVNHLPFKTLILECNSQNQLLLAAQIEISTLPFQCERSRPIHVLSNKLNSCSENMSATAS